MNDNKILITFVMGTRPEIIKLAPLIALFKKNSMFLVRVVLTGQHLEMAEDLLKLFEINEDLNLKIMKSNQSLTHITSSVLNGLKDEFMEYHPKLLLFKEILLLHWQQLLRHFLIKFQLLILRRFKDP